MTAIVQLVCDEFVAQSVLHRALGINGEHYRSYFQDSFLESIDPEFSFVAIDEEFNRLVGCILACELTGLSTPLDQIPDFIKPVNALLGALTKTYFETVVQSEDKYLLVDIAVVAKQAQGKGIYKRLRRCVQEKAARCGFRFVVGELSAAKTQQFCISTLGHRVIAAIDYSNFKYQESRPFASIEHPASIVLVEGDLACIIHEGENSNPENN